MVSIDPYFNQVRQTAPTKELVGGLSFTPDELFHEIVHHTLAGILLDFPDVRIWREPAKEDDSKLVFALHSVEHRKAAGFGTK